MSGAWTAGGVFGGLIGLLAGCGARLPEGALVLTQTPMGIADPQATRDILDQRYPSGSRVVLVLPPYRTRDVRLLSTGFVAAGEPVVAPDGRRIFFAGKRRPGSSWQICEARLDGGPHRAVTSMPGGAMDPAVLPTGDLVFASPVPKPGTTWTAHRPAALYAQSPGGAPRCLTFGAAAGVEPTVLRDGRILFISARASQDKSGLPDLGLFTVNSDGTEVSAFALDHDGAPIAHRPRELDAGRVGFVAITVDGPGGSSRAECVQEARPFASRSPLFGFPEPGRALAPIRSARPGLPRCGSVEADGEGAILACVTEVGEAGKAGPSRLAVYRVRPGATALGRPLFSDPAWNSLEAAPVTPRERPMGHLSTVNPAARTGIILCLDANRTVLQSVDGSHEPAARIRVLAIPAPGPEQSLGEIPVQADGSFMARVPADLPLGFEALDARGRVLRRVPPSIWVRPGENRTCIGCHEPRGRTPRNQRPLALGRPLVSLPARSDPLLYTRHGP